LRAALAVEWWMTLNAPPLAVANDARLSWLVGDQGMPKQMHGTTSDGENDKVITSVCGCGALPQPFSA
jgi:hypothetical protein